MKQDIQNFIAGITAGGTTTLLLHPLDLVKTRLQISQASMPTYTLLRQIYARESFRGLYAGLAPNFVGSCVSWGLYFYLYSMFKSHALRSQQSGDSLSYHQNLIAATKAGAITSLVSNPIWLIKTRMVTQSTNVKYHGLFHAFRTIVRDEGPLALYRGLVPALFGVSHGAIQFMVYEELKQLDPLLSSDVSSSAAEDSPISRSRFVEYVAMAVTSKSIATVVTYPYQTVKSRMQSHLVNYNGILDVARVTMRKEGVRGFYRGLGTNLIRVLPGTMITFLVYEVVIDYLKQNHSDKVL